MTLKTITKSFTIEIEASELHELISALEDRLSLAEDKYAIASTYDLSIYWQNVRDGAQKLLDTLISWI